ncbi:MAG: hypothetical protein ACJ79M_18380, partial [Myxococcales bacterium]
MTFAIAVFEVRRRLRMLSTYVYFGVFFALAVFFQLAAGGAIPWANIDFGAGAKVLVNGPWALAMNMVFMGNFGVVITAAIAGAATYQDVESDTTAFFFTAPISRMNYLAGRFLGAFAVI